MVKSPVNSLLGHFKIRRMSQLNNPLHGVKLLHMVEALVAFYGWEQLAH